MSVSLNCPNCGATVGTASQEDNYKEKYYHINDDGKPICKSCGAGTFVNKKIVRILCLLPIIGLHFMVLLNQSKWYKTHSKFYNCWYIISSVIFTILLSYYIIKISNLN